MKPEGFIYNHGGFLMESILEQLYNGELHANPNFHTIIESYKQDRNKVYKGYEQFRAKLPEDLKDEFNKLMDAHLNLFPYELKQHFIDGFQIGVRMMAEVYACSAKQE